MTVLPDSADYAVGEKVTLTCLKATRYALIGDKEVSCLSSGDWSNSPYCRKTGAVILCLPLNYQNYAHNRT